jgi:hypothetical protein
VKWSKRSGYKLRSLMSRPRTLATLSSLPVCPRVSLAPMVYILRLSRDVLEALRTSILFWCTLRWLLTDRRHSLSTFNVVRQEGASRLKGGTRSG